VNFIHYDPPRVSKIYALEPNLTMIQLAAAAARGTELDVEFLDLPGERIPLEDGAVGTVISCFTLCTIPGVAEAIQGIERVLKPGGKLIFFELGIAPDSQVRRWQERWEPIHRRAFAGLSLTRDIPGHTINVTAVFRDFDDYWTPFLSGRHLRAPGYVISLDEDRRARLRERLRANLPIGADGSIHLIARAWAVRGSTGAS
jgi:SAM-dependent methyltransferase